MDVILHLGVHRTATTSFQNWMLANSEILSRQGIAFWGPERTRAGLFAGLIKRADLVSAQDILSARRSATRIRMEIDLLEDQGFHTLIISEENLIGSIPHCLQHGILYPDARGRLERVAMVLGPHLTGVAMGIRRYDAWWASMLAVERARGGEMVNPQRLRMLAQSGRGWPCVIEAVEQAFGKRPHVWTHEAMAGRHEVLLRRLAPRAALYPGQTVPVARFNAAAAVQGQLGRGYMPFSVAQRGQMTARYQNELERLRQGHRDLAIMETGGAAPGGYSAIPLTEEGWVDDQQHRGRQASGMG
ncbi:hypothetical protein [Thioclava sp. GXIMD4216]|uniref:LPS sulfotransferase NodH n=1 Tax=Thioclava litoralis TaxID=3076557 RepID=A0ABZ1DZ78_9RHOB|nr:hypothetical protein RPE78_10005 [Thioclava sp. FTW29]